MLTRGQCVVLRKPQLLDEVMRLQAEVEKFRGAAEFALDRVASLTRERDEARAALRLILAWDCLNPPDPTVCADHPWLRRLVDAALESKP